MKPIILEFSAFGPYTKKTVLDFRMLHKRSLFLIYGATGAGKTMILDAMCYALYGDEDLGGRKSKMLHSKFLDEEAETKVSFTFALGKDIYRIERTAEHKRKSRKTKIQPTALLSSLENVEDEGKVLEKTIKGTNRRIKSLLGFSAGEFRQVIVLPQGEFTKFLFASSAERELILEVLFKTSLYKDIANNLKEAVKEKKREYEALEFKEHLYLEEAKVREEGEFTLKITSLREEVGKIRARREQERIIYENYLRAFAHAKEIVAKFEEFFALQNKLAKSKEKMLEQETYRKRLERAQKASTLSELYRLFKNNEQKIHIYKKDIDRVNEEEKKEQVKFLKAEKDYLEAQASTFLYEEKIKEKIRFEEYKNKVEIFLNAQEEYIKAQKKKEKEEKIKLHLASTFKTTEDKLQSIGQKKEELETFTMQKTAMQKQYEEVLLIRKELDEISAEKAKLAKEYKHLKQIEIALRDANILAIKKEQIYEEMSKKFLIGQVASLAQNLREGDPCPVCGSRVHPFLNKVQADFPSEKELKKAKKYYKEAMQMRELQAKEKALCKQKIENLTDILQKKKENLLIRNLNITLKVSEVEKYVQQIELFLEKIHVAEKEIPLLLEKEEKLLHYKNVAQQKLFASQEVFEKLKEEVIAKNEKFQLLKNELPDAFQSITAIEEKIAKIDAFTTNVKKRLASAEKAFKASESCFLNKQSEKKSLEKAFSELQAIFKETKENFQKRLRLEDFQDEEDYLAALSYPYDTEAGRRAEKEKILKFQKHHIELEAKVKALEASIKGVTMPNIKDMDNTCQKLRVNFDKVQKDFASKEHLLKTIIEKEQEYLIVKKEISLLEKEYKTLARLAEVANGTIEGREKITFQRYVQQTLFIDVLDRANIRFFEMSARRYRFQSMKSLAINVSAGLDIEIYDTYTDMTRPIQTLSGGESFIAALSLALGLADVVESYAGGIHLDAVFIDEGFGTLDAESLDIVLGVLARLQIGGRLVGIISHVEEVRRRLYHTRLEVRKNKKGSTAKFILE